jgi:GNAT superfamily N-acetyltransferase
MTAAVMTLQGAVWELTQDKGRICREILADLPEWFGIPAAVDDYARAVEHLPMFGFVAENGQVVGFLSLKAHNSFAAEAYVLGVLRKWQRQGVGRCLFQRAEQILQEEGYVYLTVKTVAPTLKNENYADTRRFYEAIGFLPLEVLPLWGPTNPCLFMVKRICS